MVQCDQCDGWFHGRCIDVTTREVADLDQYICHPRYSRGIHRWVKDITAPKAEALRSQSALSDLNWHMPTSLPVSIFYIHSAITKHAFPTFVVLKIPQMFTLVIFEDIKNCHHSFHICGIYNT